MRGMDGLFLPPVDGILPPLFLVLADSPEEAWAREVVGPDRTLPYRFAGSELNPYPSTEEILRRSDVTIALKRAGARALFLHSACSRGIHAWARRHGIRLLMSDYLHQRRLEDKIWLDAFLRLHGIPTPAGGPGTLGRARRLPVRGRAVIQERASMGGDGTYFVDGPEGAAALVSKGVLARGERYLVRARIEGLAYGITVLVAPSRVALSAVRLQCYREGDGVRRIFAGVQWIPSAALGEPLRRRIDEIFLKLGGLLYKRGFFGFANFDFMVDERGQIFVLECNPRMSAATPQLFSRPELLSGISAGAVFLRGFLGRRRFSRSIERSGVPTITFEGSTLDIVPGLSPAGRSSVVSRELASGVYSLGAGGLAYVGPDVRRMAGSHELGLFSFARAGQVWPCEEPLGSVLSNVRLYSDRGELLAPARQILAYFDGHP
jgi:hypothetical protein